jgi:transposase
VPVATEALQRVAALYAIEAEVRGKAPELRLAVRQARSRPVIGDLFGWFKAQLDRLPGSNKTAEAVRCALSHRDGLEQFLQDERVDIDTNTVKSAARPVAPSQKYALSAGSEEGAEKWATRRVADQNVQAQQRRPAALPCRPPDPPRKRLATGTHR